jgi:hypothetical protein
MAAFHPVRRFGSEFSIAGVDPLRKFGSEFSIAGVDQTRHSIWGMQDKSASRLISWRIRRARPDNHCGSRAGKNMVANGNCSAGLFVLNGANALGAVPASAGSRQGRSC